MTVIQISAALLIALYLFCLTIAGAYIYLNFKNEETLGSNGAKWLGICMFWVGCIVSLSIIIMGV